MDYLLVIAGFAGLILGGDLLVRGAVSVAGRAGLSPLVIGITLVGFGTSTPELLTSLQAAFSGSPGIAIGNVVGSNIANILLILGIAALLAPVAVSRAAVTRDGAVVLGSALLAAAVMWTGAVGRGAGLMLIVALVAYLVWAVRSEPAEADQDPQEPAHPALWLSLLQFAGGLVVTILAARILVSGAINIAGDLGVSETVIGLTIVAVGTSLPELVTSVVAARKGRSDVALGNVLGSNIFNILGILGITAMIQPMSVPAEILALDLWVMLGASVLLIAVILSGWRVTSTEGGVMVLLYAGYLGWLVQTQG